MAEPIASNKRAAKNAMMMTIRTIISTLVGLYTSRIVFNALGVEDYGIYGAVGGIVGMLRFLNGAMAGATSRFITFELGRGDKSKLADTFSGTVWAHVIIAAFVFIVAEIAGVWFLNAKMNIPDGRMYAANWVLQFSIISAVITIIQTPYNAALIAHERMSVYAYFDILNITLKLLIVYLLQIGNFDKLIFYTGLLLAVSVMMQLIYRFYCISHFDECHLRWRINTAILKPILKYSALDLYGNLCYTVSNQGRSILINLFFNVIHNAAASIALTVQGIAAGLSSNISLSFRPQIIKLYACGDIRQMQTTMSNAIIFTLIMFSAIAVPSFFEADFILKFWLGDPPQLASLFLQILLISYFFAIINNISTIAIHATGNIKRISYISGSIYLSKVVIIYLFFRSGFESYAAFVIDTIMTVCIALYSLFVVKKQINRFQLSSYLLKILKLFFIIIVTSIIPFFICRYLPQSLTRLVVNTLSYILVISILTYTTLLDTSSRIVVKKYINNIIFKLFRR